MTTYRFFPSTNGPVSSTSFGSGTTQGLLFEVTGWGNWLDGYWIWRADSAQSASTNFGLWQATNLAAGTVVPNSTVSTTSAVAGQWNYVALPTPINLSSGIVYKAVYGIVGNFPNSNNEFGSGDPYAAGITSGVVTAYSAPTGSLPTSFNEPQMTVATSVSNAGANYPTVASNDFNGWIDILADTSPPGGTVLYQAFPSMPVAISAAGAQTGPFTLGMEFSLTQACTLQRIWHYSPPGVTVLPSRCGIWNVGSQTEVAGTDNSSPTWSGAAGSGWIYCDYSASAPVLSASTNYKVSTFSGTASGWFLSTTHYWDTGPGASGITNGPLVVANNASASPGQNSWNSGATWTYPNTSSSPENDWVDVSVTPYTAPANVLYQMRLFP